MSLARFQERLESGEAALVYRAGKSQSFVLWATREQAGLRRLAVRESEAIEWLDALRADPDGAQTAKRSLARVLLGGVPAIESASLRRVWIVADGVFSLLPFELLPVGESMLIERVETAYLPAASFLRSDLAAESGVRWPWQRQMTAYAEPDMKNARLLPGDERWPALAQSGVEVAAIATILPGASVIFRGADVTPAALLDRAAGAPILHLATHGAGDPESEQRNRMLIGASYLYGAQLEPRRLPGLRLAVLSACETESGPLSRGEGVQSLARAFLLAGARSTVASLWKVDDAATRLLMERFYRRLAEGAAISTALRGAKLDLLRSDGPLSKPRYWAAFVVQGAAEERFPNWMSWPQLLAAAGVLASMAAILFWAANKKRSPN